MLNTRVTSNARALSQRYHARGIAVSREVLRAEQQSARALVRQAQILSSGPFKTKWLRVMARKRGAGLYSRRSPAPPADPAIINEQIGRIKVGWVARVFIIRDGTRITLYNTARHAKFMLGTAKMIERPILERVKERERAARVQRLVEANRRAMKVKG